MSLQTHNVPSMPELAMLADNGGIVTVNPDWCDWYEQVFNEPAGAGYIKGREIMHQVDQSYSELVRLRSEAVKSAIHSMISNDPNRPTVHFNSISEARKSYELAGKHAMDFDKEEQVFTFDGYFSVKDMEAILFIRRAEELIAKAGERFSGFFDNAAASAEDLDVNQLMQVMLPSLERTDVDSQIFAMPVDAASYFGGSPNRAAMMGGKSPMAEIFSSVVEAHATLTESGILRQNLTRAVNGSFMIDGFFTPKDLEAILYLYRNNDPLMLPEKDANGLPKDKLQDFRSETVFPPAVGRPAYKMTDMHGDRGVICEVWPDNKTPLEGVAPEVEVIIDQDSIDRRLMPTADEPHLRGARSIWCSLSGKEKPEGHDTTPPALQEGDVLHRTHIADSGLVLHIAYDRNGDQAFYQCTKQGNLIRVEREPVGTRGGARQTIDESYQAGLAGLYDAALENPSVAKALRLSTGADLEKKLHTEIVGGGLRRGEWPGEVSARTAINRTTVVGGTRIHCFEEGDDDFPMLSSLLKKLETFVVDFADVGLQAIRIKADAPWAEGGELYFVQEDGHFSVAFDKEGATKSLFSLKVAEFSNPPGQVVVFEHNPSIVGYGSIAHFFEAFNSISPEQVASVKAAAIAKHGE